MPAVEWQHLRCLGEVLNCDPRKVQCTKRKPQPFGQGFRVHRWRVAPEGRTQECPLGSEADICSAVVHVRLGAMSGHGKLLLRRQKSQNIAGVRDELRVGPKTFGRLKCASGTAELGSCLTDATPKVVPGAPSSIRRYVRPERLALAIVAAFLTRWYHIQNLRAAFANLSVVTSPISSPVH